jgi:hypothetical protein
MYSEAVGSCTQTIRDVVVFVRLLRDCSMHIKTEVLKYGAYGIYSNVCNWYQEFKCMSLEKYIHSHLLSMGGYMFYVNQTIATNERRHQIVLKPYSLFTATCYRWDDTCVMSIKPWQPMKEQIKLCCSLIVYSHPPVINGAAHVLCQSNHSNQWKKKSNCAEAL